MRRQPGGKSTRSHWIQPEWDGSCDLDGPVADASDDIDGAAEGLNVAADSVHFGDLAMLDLRDPRLCDAHHGSDLSRRARLTASSIWSGTACCATRYASCAPRGRVCQLGFLGGLEPVAGFNPIADLPSGVQFSFYGSAFVLGTSEFPLTEIPLTEMIGKAENGLYQAKPARVFGFDDIVEAHQVMESGQAGGKMTVSVT
jgi:NADPH:quinone reductase